MERITDYQIGDAIFKRIPYHFTIKYQKLTEQFAQVVDSGYLQVYIVYREVTPLGPGMVPTTWDHPVNRRGGISYKPFHVTTKDLRSYTDIPNYGSKSEKRKFVQTHFSEEPYLVEEFLATPMKKVDFLKLIEKYNLVHENRLVKADY